jgi:peptidoglycan/LPS O-acetylase OafA/YrhL
MTGKHFIALDSLRGFAALYVVSFHMLPFWPGWLMVDFFFALSGFVLSHAYLYSGRDTSGLQFVFHRLARLYPLHVFALFFFIFSYVVREHSFPTYADGTLYTFLQQLTLTHSIGMHTTDQPWNGPSWSVSVEFWVSILFFFLVKRSTPSIYLFIISAVCLLVIYNKSDNGLLVVTENFFGIINSGLLRCVCSFLCGVLTYRAYLALKSSEGLLRRVPWTFMEILSLLAVAFIILARRNSVSDIDMFAPPVFMMLILVFAFDHGWISRMLKRTIYLGKISYSIYLNHVPVIGLLMVLDIKGPFFLPAVYVVTLIVSHFSYQYIEKPCRTRVRRFGDFLERELGQS